MTTPTPLVLVVEDDAPIRRFLRAALAESGFRVEEATSATDAMAGLVNHPPDLVLLDLGLPDRDGLDLLRELRGWSRVPVIVLSARDREHDKVVALDAGADDYLSKPFGIAELRARMRVALRHAAATGAEGAATTFAVGDLVVDLAARRVIIAGREPHLTPHEFKLLSLLVKNAGKVLTHRQLLHEVWGPEYGDENHYVRVYMAQLRRKIEADPARPRYIRTEPGVGYRLVDQ
ncbi:MAG TPA: response regulator [Thermoanaerobaculaceae bacterium]|nr:response regulator [Thermoanaerobaculaceae bacterium]HPS79248.1 response regulator [Thermoanaerobaculaceae bacterium]